MNLESKTGLITEDKQMKYENSVSEVNNLVRYIRPTVTSQNRTGLNIKGKFFPLERIGYLNNNLQGEWKSIGRLDSEKISTF